MTTKRVVGLLFLMVLAVSLLLVQIPTASYALVLPDVDLDVDNIIPTVEAGQKASFRVVITNNEAEAITMRLFITGPYMMSWMQNYEYYPIIVQPEQSYAIPIQIIPDVNADIGVYEYTVSGDVHYGEETREMKPTTFTMKVMEDVDELEMGALTIRLSLDRQEYTPGDEVSGTLTMSDVRIPITTVLLNVQLLASDGEANPVEQQWDTPFTQDPFTTSINLPLDEHIPPDSYLVKVTVTSDQTILGTVQSWIEVSTVSNVAQHRDVDTGILGRTIRITLENAGNVLENGTVTERVNWFDKLLTSTPKENRPAIDKAQDSFFSDYLLQWEYADLAAGEITIVPYTYSVSYLPIVLLVLLVLILIGATIHTMSPVSIEKNVIKQSLGTKALKAKIALNVKNVSGRPLKEVTLIEYIPALAKPDDFGTIQPANIQNRAGSKIVQWDLNSLKPKEERLITYTLVTNYGVLGRVALPAAVVRYTLPSGKRSSTRSNPAECGSTIAKKRVPPKKKTPTAAREE